MLPPSHTAPAPDRPHILICDPIHPDGIAMLEQQAQVDIIDGEPLSIAELEARIGAYHAVIVRSRTALPASVIRRGKHLRVIARAGAGLSHIDVEVARAMGIEVVRCADAHVVAVAEHTLALMLALARHLPAADRSMKAGQWERSDLLGTGLAGKTLGIIGFGRIGRLVAARAKAFDMKILVNQTRLTPELAQEWRVENVDLLDLLAASDFVTIHVPPRPENRGLLAAHELHHMRPTAYLINTTRGGVVDEAALLDALSHGLIAGAGLDVFDGEPGVRAALAAHPHVLATPHLGARTEDAQRKLAVDTAQQVLRLLRRSGPAAALSLRMVSVSQVHPHEMYQSARVERLADRLAQERTLLNPPIVVEVGAEARTDVRADHSADHSADYSADSRYVVLDGATRVSAFRKLAYPHVVVQVVDVERDNVQLFAWNHAVRDVHDRGGTAAFFKMASKIEGLRLAEVPVAHVVNSVHERGALGYILTPQRQAYLLEFDKSIVTSSDGGSIPATAVDHNRPAPARDWLEVLNELVDGYGEWGDVERLLTTDMEQVQAMHEDAVALIAFSAFTPSVVLQLAAQGRLLPAGITRFVIPGRILRLNVPLEKLINDEPLSLKQDWLDRFVADKLSDRQVRYYEEPVMLLDE